MNQICIKMNSWHENMLGEWTNEEYKPIIYHVMGYPILDRVKYIHFQEKDVIENNTLAKWNDRGMSITTIKDSKIELSTRFIVQKF